MYYFDRNAQKDHHVELNYSAFNKNSVFTHFDTLKNVIHGLVGLISSKEFYSISNE